MYLPFSILASYMNLNNLVVLHYYRIFIVSTLCLHAVSFLSLFSIVSSMFIFILLHSMTSFASGRIFLHAIYIVVYISFIKLISHSFW